MKPITAFTALVFTAVMAAILLSSCAGGQIFEEKTPLFNGSREKLFAEFRRIEAGMTMEQLIEMGFRLDLCGTPEATNMKCTRGKGAMISFFGPNIFYGLFTALLNDPERDDKLKAYFKSFNGYVHYYIPVKRISVDKDGLDTEVYANVEKHTSGYDNYAELILKDGEVLALGSRQYPIDRVEFSKRLNFGRLLDKTMGKIEDEGLDAFKFPF